ncbi:MAG: hypothetical protein ACE5PV_12390 [Candidatus Poribacteria bacterium]
MLGQTVTLKLPEKVWEWAKRTAMVTQRPVEKVLYDNLLEKNRKGILTAQEQKKLEQPRKNAEHIMLMRTRAFVLLQWRGYRLPTIDELEKQVGC